jgi:hypothetical protein
LLAHFTQALLPFTDLYSPRAHGAQGPPLTPVNPGKHRHAVIAVDPVGAEALAGQSVQAELPSDDLKVLAGHCAQELTF